MAIGFQLMQKVNHYIEKEYNSITNIVEKKIIMTTLLLPYSFNDVKEFISNAKELLKKSKNEDSNS